MLAVWALAPVLSTERWRTTSASSPLGALFIFLLPRFMALPVFGDVFGVAASCQQLFHTALVGFLPGYRYKQPF